MQQKTEKIKDLLAAIEAGEMSSSLMLSGLLLNKYFDRHAYLHIASKALTEAAGGDKAGLEYARIAIAEAFGFAGGSSLLNEGTEQLRARLPEQLPALVYEQ